jgi:hypothetical protein
MSDQNFLSNILKDVNLESESAAFYARADGDIRRTASLPSDGRICIPRKPKKDSHIVPSSLRPHVLASDRLLMWTTPHSQNFQQSLEAEIPAVLLLKLFQTMLCSLDENTRNNYGAGLLQFTQFCDAHHIPETQRMPASENLLTAFASAAAGSHSPSALTNWLAGLQFWHVINGASWKGSDRLHHVRRGFVKLAPPDSKRAKRPPVTIEAMTALKDGLDLSNAFDAAIWAVASIAFWCCCR